MLIPGESVAPERKDRRFSVADALCLLCFLFSARPSHGGLSTVMKLAKLFAEQVGGAQASLVLLGRLATDACLPSNSRLFHSP